MPSTQQAFSRTRRITDSDFRPSLGEVGDSKMYKLKCAPNFDSLTIFGYFNVHENVHPDLRGVIFTVPDVIKLYTIYHTSDYFWIRTGLYQKITDQPTVKYRYQKKTWHSFMISIQGQNLGFYVQGQLVTELRYCRYCLVLPLTLVNKFELFGSTGEISVITGSYGTDPSFKGTIGGYSMKCGAENFFKDNDYYLAGVTETKFKGLWYFDENTIPRPNLANPYNLEPRFKLDDLLPPEWDDSLKRWKVHNGRKMVLQIGNFLNFRPTELVRGITIVVDFGLVSPPTPLSRSLSSEETIIATLSSDIKIAIFMRGSDRALTVGYQKTDTSWSTSILNYPSTVPSEGTGSVVFIFNLSWSLVEPTKKNLQYSISNLQDIGVNRNANIKYFTNSKGLN